MLSITTTNSTQTLSTSINPQGGEGGIKWGNFSMRPKTDGIGKANDCNTASRKEENGISLERFIHVEIIDSCGNLRCRRKSIGIADLHFHVP